MQVTAGRVLSLLIATMYGILLIIHAGTATGTAVKDCLVLLIPLALIWFPEEIGGLTGYFKSGYVNV